MELWKPINGYEGFYEISSCGNVRSLPHFDKMNRYRPGKLLQPQRHDKGYLQITLCKEGAKKRFYIHRLVADAFIQNQEPTKYCEINHIDENKTNNHVDNLEWCYHKYNMTYGTLLQRKGDNTAIPVVGTDIKTGEEKFFRSQTDAAKELGVTQAGISNALRGKRKNGEKKIAYGYTWRYKEAGQNG